MRKSLQELLIRQNTRILNMFSFNLAGSKPTHQACSWSAAHLNNNNSRQHSAIPSRPLHPPPSAHSPSQPGNASSNIPSSSQSQPHQTEQHHDYHQMATKWNVRRTPAAYYPPGVLGPRSSKKKQSPQQTKPAAVDLPLFGKQADKLQTVLDWEAKQEYINTTGKNGEKFSSWAANALHELANELRRNDQPALAQQSKLLAKGMNNYNGMMPATRALAINEARTMAAAALKAAAKFAKLQQQENERLARLSGISSTTTSSSSSSSVGNGDDVAAAEAHEEETAPAPPSLQDSFELGSSNRGNKPGLDEQVDDDEFVMIGGRRVKAKTAAFRKQFAETAAALDASGAFDGFSGISDISANGEQRTAKWLSLRERRLTASAFSKALGFFSGDRTALWEEKLGIRPPFAGNEATRWGVKAEPMALDCYEQITGQHVEPCMFQVKHDDAPHGWLGASPDGLIGGLAIPQKFSSSAADSFEREQQGNSNSNKSSSDIKPVRSDFSLDSLQGPGILEIKCPFNKGRPDLAVPPEHAIWYYMPQLQGLMDIFDREWCNLYIWTPSHGSAIYYVPRNRDYWRACFEVLAEFWWVHVVPARQAIDAGEQTTIQDLKPSEAHGSSVLLKQWSKRLAVEAPVMRFAPQPTNE